MSDFDYGVDNDSLAAMLDAQHDLQLHAFGVDIDAFTEAERVAFISSMVLAMQAEIIEALDESTWKPWDKRAPAVDGNALVGELVDVWHFLMNLFLVAMPGVSSGVIAQTIHDRYNRKNATNAKRQLAGYLNDNKCPRCKRALDDEAVSCEKQPAYRRRDGELGTIRYYCGRDTVYVSSSGVEV